MYEYREKKEISERIKSNESISADKKLLGKYDPESPLLRRELNTAIGETLAFDLVYTLLDKTSEKEILANRKGKKAEASPAAEEQVPEEKKKAPEPTPEPAPKPSPKPVEKKKSSPKSAGKTSKKKTSKGQN